MQSLQISGLTGSVRRRGSGAYRTRHLPQVEGTHHKVGFGALRQNDEAAGELVAESHDIQRDARGTALDVKRTPVFLHEDEGGKGARGRSRLLH